MWKLAPASNSNHIFSEGDKIRVRSGNHVSHELTLVRRAHSAQVIWSDKRINGARENLFGWARQCMTRGAMSEMGDFYGRTIDLWVEEEQKPEVKSDVPPNTRVMVHKSFTKLVDGLRLAFKPYQNAVGVERCEYIATVSHHSGIVQVHIKRNGSPITAVNFTQNLDNLTAADLHMFAKYECYLIKNYQPTAGRLVPETKAVNLIQEATPPAKKNVGKFIVWCPSSNLPPQVVHDTESQAKAVAASMSERYNKEFYWAELKGRAEQKVVQTIVQKIVEKRTTVFA